MVALDAMTKASDARVLQAELNDMIGVVLKVEGDVAAVEASIAAGVEVAKAMGGRPVSRVIGRPSAVALAGIQSKREFNPLMMQDVVFFPTVDEERSMAEASFALG